MTNDEIRLKIAELKGWKNTEHLSGWFALVSPTGKASYTTRDVNLALSGSDVPNWPESIADAWGLVEEWRASKEVDSIIYKTSDMPDINGHYPLVNTVLLRHSEIYRESDNIARAISLAFIAWKEAQG